MAMSPPRPATVLAIEILPRGAAQPGISHVATALAAQLGVTLGDDCHIQQERSTGSAIVLSGIVPDQAQALAPLRHMQAMQTAFHRQQPDLRLRYVVHYGLVFQSATGAVGSALRFAHSRLQRLPAHVDTAATRDFLAFAETWPGQAIQFDDIPDVAEDSGFQAFSFSADPPAAAPPAPAPAAPSAAAADPALSPLRRYLCAQLTEHLGPFAEVLVASAEQKCSTPLQLIVTLSHEIDNPKAREVFLEKARRYLSDPLAG